MNENTTSPTMTPGRALTVPRLRTIVYWVATAPILLETAVGAEWDLAAFRMFARSSRIWDIRFFF
jgi:hypothetical protein